MDSRRLYTASKRRRQVYLRKSAMVISVVIIAIAALSLGVALSGNLAFAQENMTENVVEKKYYKSIEISSGDTLWDIAEVYMNDDYDSVKDYIDDVRDINGLSGNTIHEGQYLTVPYYDAI